LVEKAGGYVRKTVPKGESSGMRPGNLLRGVLVAAVVLAAGAQAPFAVCGNFGGFAVFQCGTSAFFQPPPDFDPNVYVVDPNTGSVTNISAVFWQIGFGNNTINSGLGSAGTGMAGVSTFNGNDSGLFTIDLKDGPIATGNVNLPQGSLCLSSNNWANTGVDGCCDNDRTALLLNSKDNILNPYYDVYYALNGGPGYYSLDWQQDYPMAVLLKNVDGRFFALAAVATASRGNTGTGENGPCNAGAPGTNPAPCNFQSGNYNFRDVNNGVQNPFDGNRLNEIPWQTTPIHHIVSDTLVDPNDPNNSDHLLDLDWTAPTIYSDQSVRSSTNPGMGGGLCTSPPGCNGGIPTNDPTRAPGVGVNDVFGKFGGFVRYVVEVGDKNDPNFLSPVSSTTTTSTSLSGLVVPAGDCVRLTTTFGKIPETSSPFSTAACRLGKCGDIGFSVTDIRSCGSCVPTGPEVCDGLDNDCNGLIDDGNPGSGQSCSTGLLGVCAAGITDCQSPNLICVQQNFPSPDVCDGLDNDCNGDVDPNDPGGGGLCTDVTRVGECSRGVTHCLTDVNTHVTALKCAQLTIPDPNLPFVGDPNRNENPNDIVADPNHPLLFPQAEVCNGKDDNCNGANDDNLANLPTCGVGVCRREGTCDPTGSGVITCTPGSPDPNGEQCNGMDDNCNGLVDETDPNDPTNHVGVPCDTGRPGLCAAGFLRCIGIGFSGVCLQRTVPDPNVDTDPNGVFDPNIPVADPNHPSLFPQTETCNNLDDNCDGLVDNFTPVCGVGVCERTGTCIGGVQSCTPGQPGPTEFCDGLDNDCNGIVDDVNPNTTISPCTLYFTVPLNGDVLDCSDPANSQPTLTWHPVQFDKFNVFINTDPNFRSTKGITSGKPLLTSTSWKVPKKKWEKICKMETDGGNLYIKIQGLDVNVTTNNPLRRFFSPVVVTTVSKP
jgi:hypothetical protein